MVQWVHEFSIHSNSHDRSAESFLLPWSYLSPFKLRLAVVLCMLFELHSCQPVVIFLFACFPPCFLAVFLPCIFYNLLTPPPCYLQKSPSIFNIMFCGFSPISRLSTLPINLHCGAPSSPARRVIDQFSRDQLTILLPAGPGGKRKVSVRLVTK